jgi:hypothetical protein
VLHFFLQAFRHITPFCTTLLLIICFESGRGIDERANRKTLNLEPLGLNCNAGSDNNEDYVDQTIEGRQLTKVEGYTKSIWLAMLGYVSGGVAHTSTGWAGRFIVLGFGWFVYISVSSYTANLASFMISTVVPLGLISTYGDIPKVTPNPRPQTLNSQPCTGGDALP